MWLLVMQTATFRLHTARLHQALRSTGYTSPSKGRCSAVMHLVHFDPRCFGVLFPRWSAAVRFSCCCETSALPVPRPASFQNTLTTPDTIRYCDPHWYTRKVIEAIHIRLHPNNINGDSGIEIREAWMPTINKHNNRRTGNTLKFGSFTYRLWKKHDFQRACTASARAKQPSFTVGYARELKI